MGRFAIIVGPEFSFVCAQHIGIAMMPRVKVFFSQRFQLLFHFTFRVDRKGKSEKPAPFLLVISLGRVLNGDK